MPQLADEREPPQFVLVVHVLEDEEDTDAVSTGWVVLRKLNDFIELHRKLRCVLCYHVIVCT